MIRFKGQLGLIFADDELSSFAPLQDILPTRVTELLSEINKCTYDDEMGIENDILERAQWKTAEFRGEN